MMLVPKIVLPEGPENPGFPDIPGSPGIPEVPGSPGNPAIPACAVPQLMLAHGVLYHRVETVNWPDAFPYQPTVEVALAHTGTCLLLHYRVSENCLRAEADGDGGRVWEDSCCELFLQPQPSSLISPPSSSNPHPSSFISHPSTPTPYYNIECNCAGTLLVAAGESRHDRRPAPAELLRCVSRWSSLVSSGERSRLSPSHGDPSSRRIPLTDGPATWELALVIPAATFFESGLEDLSGQTMRGNVYKCGDRLTTPHFLSLFPIQTAAPDFHRPEFFQTIQFAG